MKQKTLIQLLLVIGICVAAEPLFAQHTDTITSLRNAGIKKAVYKSPGGKFYKVQFWDDPFDHGLHTASAQCGEDGFKGAARKGPKTSTVKTGPVMMSSIKQLITNLPDDATMIARLKGLPKPQLNKRQPEENKNVRLANNIFLFAIKRESDNDYHVIIGDKPNFKQATLLNVEVAGIANADVAALQKIRDFFEDNFVNVCGSKYVVFVENPIAITVEGSLFYDIDHKPGQIGPGELKSQTSWEIHPVLKIAVK
jgi:hypothetical protein